MNISNMTITISDARTFFWQWDTGCKLRVTGAMENSQVHFYRDGMEEPLAMTCYTEGEHIVCDVPDEILQIPKKFAAYTYIIDENGGKTHLSKTFTVESRPKPANYIYTPTEKHTVEEIVAEAIEKALGGEIDFESEAILDVEELPTDGINTSLLYRTAEGVYWYDGEWHKIVDENNIPKQEEIVFDGEYNAETNKAATVDTVVRKVAEIVANAPEDFDTLKELSDWLTSHEGSAAEMNSAIKANADSIAEINEGLTDYAKLTDVPTTYDELKDRPFGELSEEESFVDITYNPIQTGDYNPEATWALVSYDTFSLNELTDQDAPFYVEIRDNSDGYITKCKVSDSNNILEDDFGNIKISFNHNTSNGSGSASFCVITDHQKCNIGSDTPFPRNGVYFIHDSYLGARVNRLYRTDTAIHKLDNKYLDLANNEYLNGKFGDIESALDGIISMQDLLIGGES